jgi:hypothetical protein
MMASGITSSIGSVINRGSTYTRSTKAQALSAAKKSRLNLEMPPTPPKASVRSICTRIERWIFRLQVQSAERENHSEIALGTLGELETPMPVIRGRSLPLRP